MSSIIAYFSASGETAKAARKIAQAYPSKLWEIRPVTPYLTDDLNWMDSSSRSTLECKNPNCRVDYQGKPDLEHVEALFLGFPVWWYAAPRIIDSFLSDLDLSKLKIVPFCTSGGTGIETCERKLAAAYPQAAWLPGLRISASTKTPAIQAWIHSLNMEY